MAADLITQIFDQGHDEVGPYSRSGGSLAHWCACRELAGGPIFSSSVLLDFDKVEN